MSQLTQDYSFPSVMREKLQTVRWRQAGLSVVRAIALAACVLLVLMIASMSIDWIVTLFDTRVRVALTLLTLAGAIFILFRTGLHPLIEAFGWDRAAGHVDERVPQLEERWKTVASFAVSNQTPTNSVARAMLQQVTSEAVAMSTLVRPNNVVTTAKVRRPLMALAGSIVALLIFLAINFGQTSILLQRFWSPTANISATQLHSVTGDVVIPRGQSLEVVVELQGLQHDEALMTLESDGTLLPVEDVVLKADGENSKTLRASIDVDESFRYRVQAGDGRTEWYSVTAIDFPVLSEIRMTVTPPQYVDEPVTEKTLIPGRIRAIQGSQFELAMKPEQELTSLTLLLTIPADSPWLAADESSGLPDINTGASAAPTDEATSSEVDQTSEENQETPPVQKQLLLTKGSDGWYHFETQLIAGFSLSPMLLSPHGLANENPRTCQIEVIEDKAPTARIIGPEIESSAAADETVEIKFEAHDDHGVRTAELVVYDADVKEGEEPKILAVKQIPLGDQELRKHVVGTAELDLKELGLKDGQNISYAVRVTDNRDLETNPEMTRDQLMAGTQDATSGKESKNQQDTENSSKADREKSGENTAVAAADQSSESSDQNSPRDAATSKGQMAESKAGERKDDANEEKSMLLADAGHVDPKSDEYQKMLADSKSNETNREAKQNGEPNSNGEPNQSTEPDQKSETAEGDGSESKPSKNAGREKSGETSDDPKSGDLAGSDNTKGEPSAKKDGNAEAEKGSETADSDAEKMAASGDANKAADSQGKEQSDGKNFAGPNGSKKTDGEPGNEKQNGGDAKPSSEDQKTSEPFESELAAGGKARSGTPNEPSAKSVAADTSNANDGEKKTSMANADAGSISEREPSEQKTSESENAAAPKEGTQANTTPNSDLASNGNPKDATNQNSQAGVASSGTDSNAIDGSKVPQNQKAMDKPAIASAEQTQGSPSKYRIRAQEAEAGQQQETGRRKIRITDRLEALAKRNEEQIILANPVRDKVVQIDEMLKVVEDRLTALYKHEVDETLRGDGFRDLDLRLGDIEAFINELNLETQNSAFEFIGLQMIEISTGHVTPARDAVFVAIRRPDSGADAHVEEALHHVVSAREMLLALLKRYDSVRQEQELAKKIDDAIKMYTIYVEGTQRLMREAQQNLDPLKVQRSMSVIEVDQAYLDRLAEVTRMRRDMMSELAKILGDDPRLRSRYLDLIRRRRASLRNQLSEITARQDQALQEVLGWVGVSEEQRDNYWLQISDLRLDVPKEMAKEAQQYSERIEKQLPLVLDGAQGTSKALIDLSKKIALDIRRCDFAVRELRKSGGELKEGGNELSTAAADLVFRIDELLATLDQLGFEHSNEDEVADYVQLRQAEYRILADRAYAWGDTAESVEKKRYTGLARLDQHQIALNTELLRIAMMGIEADLAGQFNDEVPMPQEVTNLTQDLLRTMEAVTFSQSSATFNFSQDKTEVAAARQEQALKGLEEAGKILDQLRRKTVEALDKIEEEDPNIADLEDPTLDQFLANLEREPDIEAQLGIPNRPRNLRVVQDMLAWSQNGQSLLQSSSDAAMARMDQQTQRRDGESIGSDKPRPEEPKAERQMTEEEKKQLAEAKDMQQMLRDQMQKTMAELQEKANDPSTPEAARRQMQEMAQRMNQALEEMKKEQNSAQLWQQIVQADQAKAAMEALAKGESLPDDQWNKLMSKLDDGLGQVGGRTPPEDYRRAIEQYQERIRRLTGATAE